MKKCSTCVLSVFDERLGEYKCFHYQRYTTDSDADCSHYIKKTTVEKLKKD